jgi:hypothetical protein
VKLVAMSSSGPETGQPNLVTEQHPSPAQDPVDTQTSDTQQEQIVLIHSTEDIETGAAAAVELETSANVLVGG